MGVVHQDREGVHGSSVITVTGNALQSFEPDTLLNGDKCSHNETMDASCIGYPVLERRRGFSSLFLHLAGPPTVSGPVGSKGSFVVPPAGAGEDLAQFVPVVGCDISYDRIVSLTDDYIEAHRAVERCP